MNHCRQRNLKVFKLSIHSNHYPDQMPSLLICLTIFTFFLLDTILCAPEFACSPPHFSSFPFCNRSLPAAARARSIVSLLSLSEKISLLTNNASSIPRLGLPAYEWWSESLHGIATNGPGVSFHGPIPAATSFPQVIVMAAAFNRSLWFQVGAAIAVEARAMYNKGQAGLTFWAPNVNLFRDPRWGRGQETPGEDPMIASAFAVEFVKGFQGGEGDELMLSACCKHLTAYDLEKWGNFSRYSFNAVVSEQDMQDTYEPPFRSCVEEGKASCLMCSYNRVNGVPACAKSDLFRKARLDWGFKGYITSDCDAVATVYEYQHYSNSPEDAIADVLKAGVDTNCGTYMLRHTESAIHEGKVSEEDINKALYNLFLVQFRLGLFNGDPRKGKFGLLGSKDVCSKQHRELALDAARQGIVLLKNENNFLPLNKRSVPSLAVIGPMANTTNLGGGYSGIACNPRTLFEELKLYPTKTNFAAGCPDVACDINSRFDEAIHVAKESEYVIVVAGLDLTQETEDHDRTNLLLPGKQMDLVKSIASVSKNPMVLVITGGGPLDVSFAENNPRVASILWIGYPGETGGKALAEIVFGYSNPGGRLPVTWYPESFTKVAMNDMNMRANRSTGYPGRTYRFYTGDAVYNFGHGLSYSNFTYKLLSAPKKVNLLQAFKHRLNNRYRVLQETNELHYIYTDELAYCDSLRFSVRVSVRNVGNMRGTHVVMLFVRAPKGVEGTPEKQLIGFDRVHVVPHGRAEVAIDVDPCQHLSSADESGRRVLSIGEHVLILGDLEHSLFLETGVL